MTFLRKINLQWVGVGALILLFFAPLIILFIKSFNVSASSGFAFRGHDVYRVFIASVLQALLSSVGSLLLGLFGALGLLSLRPQSRKKKIIELMLMMPGLLPTLFVVVACLNFISMIGPFPFGIWGVVIVHVCINMGLVAVAISRLLESQLGGMIELATIEGASRFQILRVIVREFQNDFFSLGFVVFALSFTSFSVPLIVGAHYGETVDVFIYRVVMGSGDLKLALILTFIQMIVLAVFSLFIKQTEASRVDTARNCSAISSPVFLFIVIAAIALLLIGSLSGLGEGLSQLQEMLGHNPEILQNLLVQIYGTAIECVGVFFICILFFIALILLYPNQWLHRFLLGYVSPSVVVVGLSFYFLFNLQEVSKIFTLLCLAIAFSFTIIPTLYRLRVASLFSALSGQVKVAQVLGARPLQISQEILWPQMRRDIFFISGIGAFWASGDFALSSMIAGRELTLGIAAKSLLGGYRLELATLLTWVTLLIGGFIFIMLEAISRVFDKKSNS